MKGIAAVGKSRGIGQGTQHIGGDGSAGCQTIHPAKPDRPLLFFAYIDLADHKIGTLRESGFQLFLGDFGLLIGCIHIQQYVRFMA